MNSGEYEALARVEEEHWWYKGLRGAVKACLLRQSLRLPESPRVLDAGCGTGGNLRLLADLVRPSYLAGFDLSDRALAFARRQVPSADVYCSDLCAPKLRQGDYDLITSFDAITAPGMMRAGDGVRQLVEALHAGGLFIVNLPAYSWLHGEHDWATNMTERVTASQVRECFQQWGLECELVTYRVCLLFPAMVASRIVQRSGARSGAQARSDLQQPPGRVLNGLLQCFMDAENVLLARGLSLPFGGSVFAIGRRPGK